MMFIITGGVTVRADAPAVDPPMVAAPTEEAAFGMITSVFQDPRAQGIPFSATVMPYDQAMADIGNFSASFGPWGRTYSVLGPDQQLVAYMVTRFWDSDQSNEGWGAFGVWWYAKVVTRNPGSEDAMLLTIDFLRKPDGSYRMWPQHREDERRRLLDTVPPS